jgi:uncharacterized protein YdhG (YjbR/CyaY superfamily)
MPKAEPTSVDEYIASQPESVRATLERVRRAIRRALPGAEELISYKMPAYRLNGEGILHFASWKKHYSLYLASESIVAQFKDELARYETQKGTISFPITEPVPEKLIERIAKFRAKEVAERTR